MLDEVGDVSAAFNAAEPADLYDLYESFQLELRYDPLMQIVDVHPLARMVSERVRGGTRTPMPYTGTSTSS